MPAENAAHQEPVWRDRADFLIIAPIPDAERSEQLWARQLGPARFEVCCIPFFLYDIALGDVVETTADYLLERVIEPSGRYVFRVWFGDSFHPQTEIADELVALGALIEWSSPHLLAVDAGDIRLAEELSGRMAAREREGHLTYETGRS